LASDCVGILDQVLEANVSYWLFLIDLSFDVTTLSALPVRRASALQIEWPYLIIVLLAAALMSAFSVFQQERRKIASLPHLSFVRLKRFDNQHVPILQRQTSRLIDVVLWRIMLTDLEAISSTNNKVAAEMALSDPILDVSPVDLHRKHDSTAPYGKE
jgi:hypothetical protein